MTSDNDSTSTSFFALLYIVNVLQTFTLVGGLELFSEIVITDTASVNDRVGRQNIL